MNCVNEKQQLQIGYLTWLVTLGIVISANFDQKIQAREVAFLGPTIWGISAPVFMSIIQILFFLPLIPVFKHFAALVIRAQGRGRGFKVSTVLLHGFSDPEARRSAVIALAGLLYGMIGMAFWVVNFAPSNR